MRRPTHPQVPADRSSLDRPATVEIDLSGAILSIRRDEPVVLTVQSESSDGRFDSLPSGPFTPLQHRTLDLGLRSWVSEQTNLDLGYVEQLYTFADRGRHARETETGPHVVSIGYLALTRLQDDTDRSVIGLGQWRSWYDFFPWEDWRGSKPAVLTDSIEPLLVEWSRRPDGHATTSRPLARIDRIRMAFGVDRGAWDEERVLDRYELLYEAGLVMEARRDGREAALSWGEVPRLGQPMQFDHRRILATAVGRLRGKIKYRPVVFELMANEFTLFELQKTVEAILGPHLHKQNFRRLVESAGLVEPTGDVRVKTGGRPAKLYRFRPEVVLERPAPGVRVKPGRS
ncbi:MAG: NAD regulator [Hyphomicrobiaceae bacterium]